MITQEKMLTMLHLQDALNQKIHPQWRDQGFKWTRAIVVEAVEALDHYGWKWWKQQEPDLGQVRIELVDIWHFMLSDELSRFADIVGLAEVLTRRAQFGAPAYLIEVDSRRNLEALIASAAVNQLNMNTFMALMVQCGLTWGQLYATYVAKNVLNTFRQDHGYKVGTYIKNWNGVEDNVALEQLMTLKADATPEQLRAKLESVYAKVLVTA